MSQLTISPARTINTSRSRNASCMCASLVFPSRLIDLRIASAVSLAFALAADQLTDAAEFALRPARLGNTRDALPHLVAQHALETAISLTLAALAETEPDRLGAWCALSPRQLSRSASSSFTTRPSTSAIFPSSPSTSSGWPGKRRTAHLALPQTWMVEERASRASNLPTIPCSALSCCWRRGSWRWTWGGRRRRRRSRPHRYGGRTRPTGRQAHRSAHSVSDATQRALGARGDGRARGEGIGEPAHPAGPLPFFGW